MSPDLDRIRWGLEDGKRAAESLLTWLGSRPEAYDRARDYITSCQQGLDALDTLRTQLRDGQKYIEAPEREMPRECYCSATSHPPCSFCESGATGEP